MCVLGGGECDGPCEQEAIQRMRGGEGACSREGVGFTSPACFSEAMSDTTADGDITASSKVVPTIVWSDTSVAS